MWGDVAAAADLDALKAPLRVTTAGSVDDGKSTLIGRLLYDLDAVPIDQRRALDLDMARRGRTIPDFALLTDGLVAEREQGITVDVAYRYFSSAKRKFIVGDVPGHEQYTRNMATGASRADAAVTLVDARKGMTVQTRRHLCISALLRVRTQIIAVNKMDLIGHDLRRFAAIRDEIADFCRRLERPAPEAVPISALNGENVVNRSDEMAWYEGPSLLELLERAPGESFRAELPLRLPVQGVNRPSQQGEFRDFRGYMGRIETGSIEVGQKIAVYPGGLTTTIASIHIGSTPCQQANAPASVVVTLADALDVSRGDLIADAFRPPRTARRLAVDLIWLDRMPLDLKRPYLVKHMARIHQARLDSLDNLLDVTTLATLEAEGQLATNEIGRVVLRLANEIPYDAYAENRATGALILIDPASNATVAGGMIHEAA
jgi:sulfate adenylyltransferase large subunit